jgi:hypothetical protein
MPSISCIHNLSAAEACLMRAQVESTPATTTPTTCEARA